MLANFVQETANAPGTAATINLGGAAAGRLPFIPTFASGSVVFYGMDDGTLAEMGIGTVTAGSPNTLARTTVLWNSAGTTARMNFLGSVRVYCAVPAERAIYLRPDGTVQNATATGSALFRAADAAAARTAIGAGTVQTGALTASGLTMATARLLGRTTASSGAVEEITVGTGLSLTGGALVLSSQPQLREQLFTASGTWTAPAGVTQVQLVVIGGGGGGGGYDFGGAADGWQGGFGGLAAGAATVVPGTAYTVTVGAGGSGGATSANGTAGGTSSFGALMSATGGGGGPSSGGSPGTAGAGSSGTTRNTNIGVTSVTPFSGSILPRPTGSGAAVAWAINSTTAPGVAGAGAWGTSGGSLSAGGVRGIVYVQWVG